MQFRTSGDSLKRYITLLCAIYW